MFGQAAAVGAGLAGFNKLLGLIPGFNDLVLGATDEAKLSQSSELQGLKSLEDAITGISQSLRWGGDDMEPETEAALVENMNALTKNLLEMTDQVTEQADR